MTLGYDPETGLIMDDALGTLAWALAGGTGPPPPAGGYGATTIVPNPQDYVDDALGTKAWALAGGTGPPPPAGGYGATTIIPDPQDYIDDALGTKAWALAGGTGPPPPAGGILTSDDGSSPAPERDVSGALSGQSPSLTALQGLIGQSRGGIPSPGLQSLLEGTAGRLGGGQARQRYGRQFQTFLANQRAAQGQRGDAMMAEMGDTGASSLQGQTQMQTALDRLRAALDLPSRAPLRSRAPQFASSSSSSGGLSSATSPYLY